MRNTDVLERFISVAERFERLEARFYWNRLREFECKDREKRRKERETLPFTERLPILKPGPRINHGGKEFRIIIENTKLRNRMIVEELIRRKDEAKRNGVKRAIVDKVNWEDSLCNELGKEIGLKCTYLEKIFDDRKNL